MKGERTNKTKLNLKKSTENFLSDQIDKKTQKHKKTKKPFSLINVIKAKMISLSSTNLESL